MKIGDRVKVRGTLLYNGRRGILTDTSGAPDDPWDFNVVLYTVPDDRNPNRIIGVFKEQVEAIT